ncbi:MAG: ABC transporter permease [Aggregatilineales bacterium]
MLSRILNIARKEFLHFYKDRVLVPFLILGALGELTVVAWATSQPIRHVNMTVFDQDKTTQSAALIERLNAAPELSLQHEVNSVDDINALMDRNETTIGVVIPSGYEQALLAHQQPTIALILNGADSVNAYAAENAAKQVILEQGMRATFHLEPAAYADLLPQVTVKYNQNLTQEYYTLPAEMNFVFYIMTVALAAIAIARERERGTYEQLLVMPYRAWEVIVGKAIAPLVVGYMLLLMMLGLSTYLFHVPFRGSLLLLLVLAVIYLFAEIGKGILLSLLARTQLQAMLLVFGVAMIDLIFSGYAVAVESMPPLVQTLANFFSIRHWLIITRGIMLKAVDLSILWPHVVAIAAIGAVIIAFTATQYRRSLA